MSKIKILDKSITNRISAGEVVEKPASIVKELLENSIDAKATKITIEIENGGITKIAVTDNGEGINKEDMLLTVTPHATSKISSLEDLNTIATLGFRGEALASIASVSKMEIISKTEAEEAASFLIADGGEIISQTETGAGKGTYVCVNSLFFNTPVRAKFLRKPKSEEADITDYVERIMLAFPDIAFKYIIDGKIKYNTMSGSLQNNIYTIYGEEIANNLIEINYKIYDYKLVGYIGKPTISKPNRDYQTLLISNRYVKNYMISSSVQNAYANFMMKQKFPFFILNLILPYDNVDVNVHPNKLEVKFEKPNQIYSLFYSTVLNALNESDQIQNIKLEKQQDVQNASPKELAKDEGKSFESKTEDIKEQQEQTDIFSEMKANLKDQNIDASHFTFSKQTPINNLKKPIEIVIRTGEEINQPKSVSLPEEKFEVTSFNLSDYKIIGTLFNTYILIEAYNNFYLIDQHAAHERILYDKFFNQIKTQQIAIQELLTPFIIKVKEKESNFLSDYLNNLDNIGFKIHNFGYNTFKVLSIPYVFSSLNIADFFDELLKDIDEYKKQPFDYIKPLIAQKACKAAVKAGKTLTELEIKLILENIKNGVLHCPHGRPFVMKMDKTQIEKYFKRIL